jgi:hypothetical protein
MVIRDNPNDAVEAETRLCRGDLTNSGMIDIYDASYERRDQFWESIRIPGAQPINYTADPIEYTHGPGDYVAGSMIVPEFSSAKARFKSMHAALDMISSTPVYTL